MEKRYIVNNIPEIDATTIDSLGKSSLHPIYISLGNIRTWRRNKEDAKQLLGYLPILSANNEGQTSRFKRLAHETFHNSLKFLLDPLFDEDEIEAIEDIVHIVPRFDETNEYFVNKYLF
ncbi:hypothetical protein Glove_19g157 [Diversispora epigaea]|uniref:Uncharacterized protein n=1 Tax=Diversispora epigaea TaxID=1348612 RepID=A0A397JX60_9GLOM|nr:hypothetical protein Glove_19g157 [Diversispora epigaea]